MKRFWYDVKAELEFTKEEAHFLVERARNHYDWDCKAAGMSYEDGARENGFIKQLLLFPGKPVVWTSRQLDLTLKVLEPFVPSHFEDKTRGRLSDELLVAFKQLQNKYKELNGD